jgi:hypothetical protein
MATSLMNDSSYAEEMQRSMVAAAETIFTDSASGEDDLSLSDEELDRLMIKRRGEVLARLRQEEARIDAITGQTGREDTLPES